jgi:UDP-N-acetylmuramoyl-tripeptide--D-alanyl-D-alanine ligase
VAEAKAELLAALPADGHAVLADDPWLRHVASPFRLAVTWVGRGRDSDLKATDVRSSRGTLRFRLGRVGFTLRVWGRHHLNSALLAVAVGQHMGLDLETIAHALRRFVPPPMRCEVTHSDGVTIINDAYNASPTAMRAALELLGGFSATARKIFICGDMAELGRESVILHHRLGDQAVTLGHADVLIACGQFAPHVIAGARAAGMSSRHARARPTPEQIAPALRDIIRPGNVVLVKGSRAMRMERVVQAIRGEPLLEVA